MKQSKQSRIVAILALCVSVVGLTLGFAAFSNTLTISSSATVKPDQKEFLLKAYGVGDIYSNGRVVDIDYPEAYTSSTISKAFAGDGISGEDAIISSSFTDSGSNKITISNLKANMKNPGDQVSYFFMIKNEGRYDAYLMKSEFDKLENINEKTVCEAVVEEGKTPATQEYLDAACKEFIIDVHARGGEGLTKQLDSVGSNDEYIDIPKAGSSFMGYDYGYMILQVDLTYNGTTRVDGDFNVEFADIELEFTTTPPAA